MVNTLVLIPAAFALAYIPMIFRNYYAMKRGIYTSTEPRLMYERAKHDGTIFGMKSPFNLKFEI